MDVTVGLNNDVEVSGAFLSVDLRQVEESPTEFDLRVETSDGLGACTSRGNLEDLDELIRGLQELRAALAESAGQTGHVRFHNGV